VIAKNTYAEFRLNRTNGIIIYQPLMNVAAKEAHVNKSNAWI
jgi:hypothetical protein